MPPEESVHIDSESNTLEISNLTISDPDLVDYFGDRATEEEVQRALKVGVLSLEVAETSREVDYIEHAVTELQHEFESHIDDFTEEVESQLEENSTLIEDELDPTTDGTPTNDLKESLEQELQDVRSQIDQQFGHNELRKRTTHKGDDFEETLGHIIQDLTIGPMDDVEHTGNKSGSLNESKRGDYVITTEDGLRIVIEAKDRTSNLSKPEIKNQLDEAIRNREADTGLLVSRNASALPTTDVGWFHEFDPKRSVVVLSEDVDDEINPRFFKFAYNWSRIRAQQAQIELSEDIDAAWVDEQLEHLKDDIEDLQEMRDQAETIQQTAEELEKDLRGKETKLLRTLSEIRNEIVTT